MSQPKSESFPLADVVELLRRRRMTSRRLARRLARLIPMPLYLGARRFYTTGRGWITRPLLHQILLLARVLPIPDSHAVFTPAGGPVGVRFVSLESSIVRTLFWLGRAGYEGAYLDQWERAARGCQRIVDIGANFGLFTAYAAAANSSALVTAVEPHPRSYAALRRNVELNVLDRVRTLESAVCVADTDTVDLCVPSLDLDETPGGAYLDQDREGRERTASHMISVRAIAPSEVVADAELVKIDVEGQEHNILRAAEAAILINRPIVFLEILNHSSRLTSLLSEWVTKTSYGLFFPDAEGTLQRVPDDRIASARLSSETDAIADNFILLDERRHGWFLGE